MKICRIYIKPNGEKWFDLPLRPDQDLGIVFSFMRSEGVIMMHSSFCVPAEQVHHMSLLESADPPADKTPPVLWPPGGLPDKPN